MRVEDNRAGIDLREDPTEVMEYENVTVKEHPALCLRTVQDILMQTSAKRTAELEGRVVEA